LRSRASAKAAAQRNVPDVALTCLRKGAPGGLRLVCLPYAGAGASIFRAWPPLLPDTVDVCAVQLPGREERYRLKPHTSLSALADAATEVIALQSPLPLAFFGHSMGALLAFEIARRLRARACPEPIRLFVSAFRAPHLPDRRATIHDLPTPQLLDELRRLNGMKAEVLNDPELLELILPTLRADLRAVQTYSYAAEPPLRTPITAYGGAQDTEIRTDELTAWREHTLGGCEVKMLPGDHFFVHTAEATLLQHIAQRLQALAGSLS
jgi:medium-chain acyl-[acyl-carrier-protein] hydrolase